MAERYSRLYSLPEDLYTPGAPLVIAAGALLMDNQSGCVLAQLKLRSISPKTIAAVRLLVIGFDSGGEELCRVEHAYDGLNAERDALFGAREAIRLPDAGVRRFTVYLLAAAFSDGSFWRGGGGALKSLPPQENLNKRFFDAELIRQYRLETGKQSRFVPLETQDLWLCACGEINHKGESCYRCGQTIEHLKTCLSVERLRAKKALRLNAEAARAAIQEQRKQERGRIARRILLALLPLVLVAAIIAGIYTFTSRRAEAYGEASRLYSAGEYAEAAARFTRLSRFLNYRDAREMAAKAKKADAEIASYARAGRFLENGRYDDAYEAYLELGDYQDSAELAREALYQKGLALIEDGRYADAKAQFLSLGGYRDAPEIAAAFLYRRLSEEVSYNSECGGPLKTSYVYDEYGRVSERTEHFSAYSGMSDRVYTYDYTEDGGYAVTEGQVEMRYDREGNLIGQGNLVSYTYDYKYYEDGSVHFYSSYDAKTGAYRGSTAFDEHGNVAAIQDAEGAVFQMMNEYQDGLLVKQETYNEAGTMLGRTSFEYDENGCCKRAGFVMPGASETVTTLYENGPIYAPLAGEPAGEPAVEPAAN